jgi:hypothetical protein
MRLEDVSMEIRPRTDWEAVDSGLALARRDFWRCWCLWWLAVLPVIALLYPLREAPVWWIVLLLWAKWVGCRMILFQLSRRLFGENPTWKSLWREIPRAWGRRFFYRMVWARFSPWKPISAAVEDLEGLRGEKFSRRLNMIHRKGEGTSILLTLFSAVSTAWLALGVFFLGLLFFPESVQERWVENFDADQILASHGYLWLSAVCMTFAASLVDVFLTGAGFGLYLNSRTWIEGWDVELAFKRMANRLRGIVPLWCVLGMLCFMPSADAAEEDAPAPKEVIADIKSHEDFTIHKEKHRVSAPSSRSSSRSYSGPAFSGLEGILAGFGYVMLGLFLVALIGGIVWLIMRSRLLVSRGKMALPQVERAKVVMGMEVTQASLPKNLLEQARLAWQGGDRLLAMSLLYRGSLAWWIEHARVNIQESDTEGDCLRRVAELRHAHGEYFHALTQAWLLGAYAKHFPPQESWEELCRQWPYLERRQA